jgi:chemotaxis protein MotD
LARGLLLIKRINASVRDFPVSTVNVIQPSEPRLQPGKSPQVRDSEPFSDHLESAANRRHADENARGGPTKRTEPTASRSRNEARTDALARDETRNALARDDATAEPAEKPEATAYEPRPPENSEAHEETAADTSEQMADTVAKTDSSEGNNNPQPLLETLNNDTVVDGDEPAANVMTNDGEVGEADVSPQTASALLPQITDGEAENADSAQAPALATPVNEQSEGAPEATPATAGIARNMNSDDQTVSASPTASKPAPALASAPAPAQPATPQQPDIEAAATNPAPVEQPRGAVPPSDQPSAQQASSANSSAMAAQGEASTPFEGDPDAQLPQRQNETQPIQAKPQEAKAPPQAEIAKPLAPATDAGSPKAHPVTLPEPVRALAASFNPPGLQVANMNDRKPLPLNAAAIAVEIVSRLRDGMRRFDIRLDPPELGRIDVRLEMDRNGNVSTKLTLDRPETLELMQRDARGLERALQQAGLKTDAGGLEFSLRSHADNGPEHGHSGRSGHPLDALVTEDGERIEAVIEGYRAAAFARGGVDIRI